MSNLRGRCRVRVLLGAALVGCGLIARPAAAEPNGDVSVQAAVLYRAGVKAAEDNRPDDARALFLGAWRLKQHWQVAANLADAEAGTGRHRDAAEHFEFALRTGGDELSPQEKQRLAALLEKERASIGTLIVRVNVPGAEVLVDGKPVGKAPLAGPIYVDPGRRVIEVRREGYAPYSQKLEVAAGSSGEVELKLETLAVPLGTNDSSDSNTDRPNPKVLVAGIVGTTLAMGAGFTATAWANSARDDTPLWESRANLGLWCFAGAGAIGLSTGIYAVASSGSKPKTDARATVRVGGYPGGVIVTGTF